MSSKPWNIYAEQLFPVGYGHPLWVPEPSLNGREVLIGDVVWIKGGEVHVLFNSMRDRDDPINQARGVPGDFTIFSPSNFLVGKVEKITAPMVFSRSINARSMHWQVEEPGATASSSTAPASNLATGESEETAQPTSYSQQIGANDAQVGTAAVVPSNVPPAPNLAVGQPDKNTQSTTVDRTISMSDAQDDLVVVTPSSISVRQRFQTRSDAGAMLMLRPPGVAEDVESKRHVVNYMRDNFDSWFEFANASDSWGLDLRPEEILFVCGTLKTTQWALAAFQGSMFRNKDGCVSGQISSFGNVGISVQVSDMLLPVTHYRVGPRIRAAQVGDQRLSYPGYDTPAGLDPDVPNQCLFLHYYKMKRRLWWKEPMQAGAGPHQLPPGTDDPGSDAMSPRGGSSPNVSELEGHGHGSAYDPVNHLLDYILQTSVADIAIASDLDLTALFRDRTFPDDIPAALMELSPPVEIDDHGVGTVSVDHDFPPTDKNEDQGASRRHENISQNPPVHSYSSDSPQSSSDVRSSPPRQGAPHSTRTIPQATPNPPTTAKPDENGAGKRRGAAPRDKYRESATVLASRTDDEYAANVREETMTSILDARKDTARQNVPLHATRGMGTQSSRVA